MALKRFATWTYYRRIVIPVKAGIQMTSAVL